MANQVLTTNNTPNSGEPIGFVKELNGRVIATGGNGDERVLHVGDPVYLNDLIQTVGVSTVALDFIDGTRMDLGRNSQALLDDEVYNPEFVGDTNRMVTDVEAIQALILAGADPAVVTEETAAGFESEAGNDGFSYDENIGLNDGIIIELTGQHTTPQSGYQTTGLKSHHQQTRIELLKFANNRDGADETESSDLAVTITSLTTTDNTPEITGTVSNPSAKITVVIDGSTYDATNNGDGTWTLDDDIVSSLDAGDSDVEVIATDGAGNNSSSTGIIRVINNQPNAHPDSQNTAEDGATIYANVPTATDLDGDLDPAGYALVGTVSEGVLVFNTDGSYSFSPGSDFQDLGVGESRDVTFTYTASDTNGGTSLPAIVIITVTGTNDAPVVSGPVNATATENDALFGVDMRSGATDIDASDNLSVTNLVHTGGDASGITPLANTLAVDPSAYKYLAAGETEIITYSYDIVDSQGAVASQTASITIVGTNDTPVVTDASISMAEDSTDVLLSLPMPTDLDASDILTITVTGLPDPTLGSVTLGDGTPLANGQVLTLTEFQGLQFDTLPDANGSGVFSYSVSDGTASVPGTATITVSGSNDDPVAVDNQYTTVEDSSYSGNVLSDNTGSGIDNDMDGDSLFVSAVNGQAGSIGNVLTLASGASLTVQADGSFIYDPSTSALFNALPAGGSANDSFSYTISDGNGGSDTATVILTINGTNDAAIVSSDSRTLLETDAALSTSGTLISSDVDNPDNAFTPNSITGGYGDFSILANGNWTFTANSAFNELNVGDSYSEVFTVTSIDGTPSTVTITIQGTNDAPGVSSAVMVTATEDDASFSLDLLSGAGDVDTGDSLSISGLTHISGNAAGISVIGNSLSVDPNTYNSLAVGEIEVINYSYNIVDVNGAAVPQTASITITGANDAPTVSSAITATAGEDDAGFNIDLLAGATDVDATDSLNVSGLTLTSGNGTGITASGNSLSVDPGAYNSLATGETEVISYSYNVTDGHGGTVAQTATITITGSNDGPVVTNSVHTVAEDSQDIALNLPLPVDVDISDVLTVTVTGLPDGLLGTLTLADGSPLGVGQTLTLAEFQGLEFDTVADATGTSNFTYQVSDGTASANGTATITVGGTNDVPVAVDNSYSTTEDSSYSGNALTDNTGSGVDSDADGDSLFVSAVNGQHGAVGTTIILASGATLTMQSNGNFIYDPSTSVILNALAAGNTATDSFTYTINDGNGATDIATVTINITGTDDAPVISTGSGSVVEDTAPSVSGALSASDADNPALAFTAETITGTYGDLVVASDGSWTYTLNSNADALTGGQSASETLTVNLNDGSTTSVAINITGTNDGPVIDLDSNDSTTTGSDYLTGYTEGNGPVYIADMDTVITDSDNSVLQSATITITNAESGDLLTTGALPPGITASAYNPATGVITLTGSATLSAYQSAIKAVQFSNDGSSSGASRTIEVSVDDGTDNSAVATTTVNMVQLPTVSVTDVSVQEPASGTTMLTFTISVDQVLGADLNFDFQTADISATAGADYVGTSGVGTIAAGSASTTVTVAINSDSDVFEGDETLALNLTNFSQTVNFDASAHPITGGVQGIGTIGANNGTPDAVDDSFVTAPDTPLTTGNVLVNDALVDNAVVNTYDTTSTNGGTVVYNNDGTFSYSPPSGFTGIDTFSYQLIDDDGEVDTATVSINVSTVSVSPPVVASVPDTVYTENDSATNILTGVTLTDADSNTVSSVVVRIEGYIGSQDALNYLTAGTSVTASVSVSGNVWELTLSGGTDINEYQSVLNTITYQNTSDNPSSALRTVRVEAYDDQYNNLFGSDLGTLSVVPVNDAPDVINNAVYALENSNDFALNITAPTDIDTDDASLSITVTGLPAGLGSVMLADGVTPVVSGQILSLAELTSLVFDAGAVPGTGTFSYAVSDGNQTVTGTTTINVGTTEADVNTVYESALAGGTASGSGLDVVSGNLLSNDAMATSSIDSIDFGGSNYTATGGVITVTTGLGTLTVYADNSIAGYSVGDYQYVLNGADSTGNNVDEVFTYNFTNGAAFSDTLTISVIDDKPVANNLVEAIPESEENIFNVMFTLDISTSMNALVGTTGQTRLDLAKQALTALGREYFNQSTQVNVTVLLFADGGHTLGTYSNYSDLEAALAGIRDAGTAPSYTNNSPNDPDAFITNSTSYNDALSLIEAEFTADLAGQNPADQVQNISYFLSDGAVTSNGTPIGNGFDTFVNSNSIDSYSVGIGTGLPGDLSDLNFIHNIDALGQGNGAVDDALIITDVSLLQSELLSTVPTAFGGNITVDGSITNVLFGADSGYVESITLDVGTFSYDGTNITVPSALAGSVDINGPRLTLNADDGFAYGTFTFDFSDGTYLFNAPNGTAPNSFDINYTVVDGDGDTASAVATINIVDDAPVANDDLDSVDPMQIAEGNVITGLGTDAGPAFGSGFTSFALQGSGVDKIVDNADITSFSYKGENFDLDYTIVPAPGTSGNLSWVFGSETNIDGDLVTQVTVTDSSDNSVLVFRSNGYYNYTPDQSAAASPITESFIDGSSDQGITVTTTDNGSPSITFNASSNSGIGVNSSGDNWSDSADSGDNIILTFDIATYPNGVEDISLDFRYSSGSANAIFYDGPNATGNVIATVALNGNDIQSFAGISGVGSVEVSTGSNGDYSIQRMTFTPVVVAAASTALDPVLIDYVLTDSDGQKDSAQLSINTIDNRISGTAGADSINGGSDNDAITGNAGDDVLSGNAGNDTLAGGTGIDVLSGNDGHDYLSGGDGNDTLNGGAGNDHLAGDAGADILDGGLGNDILLGGDDDDLLFGGAGNDQLDGGAGNDQLHGGAGNDVISGGAGDDMVIGGQGDDVMTGGDGMDTFIWRNGDDGSTSTPAVDFINDFDASANGDVLDLSDLLVGEESNPLTDFLNFQYTDTDGDGDSETLVNIDADGGTIFQTTQQVILENVDLTEGGTLTTDQDILNNLLIKGTLVTD